MIAYDGFPAPLTSLFKNISEPKICAFDVLLFPFSSVKQPFSAAILKVNYTLFFFIKTSKFWPGIVVLKFSHNLSLNCS